MDLTAVRSMASAAGWGFIGAAAFGPFGFAAGILWGGRARPQVVWAGELKDGRKFLAKCDLMTWEKIEAVVCDKARLTDQVQTEQDT